MKGTEFLTIVAILLGPVLAIQVSSILERRRGARERKEKIFKVLMATRATVLSPDHIQALNAIDVEFFSQGDRDKKAKAVRDSWQVYCDHLNTPFDSGALATWDEKRKDLLIKLLSVMANCMGYEFGEVLIKKGTYFPRAHKDIEDEQQVIRKQLMGILGGKDSFRVQITDLPSLPPSDEERE